MSEKIECPKCKEFLDDCICDENESTEEEDNSDLK